MEINVSMNKLLKRAAFILGGLVLWIVTSEVVHRIYVDDPYFQWNGMLQLLWFILMFVAFLLVGYGIVLNK